MKSFLLLFVIVPTLLFSEPVSIYVSPDGNDNWSGTIAEPSPDKNNGPLATMEAALMKARKASKTDDVFIEIASGIYYLTQPLMLSPGDFSHKVTIRGSGKEPAILSGGIQIRNWEKRANDLWVADLSGLGLDTTVVRQLFINGERRFRAKTPNSGFFRIEENPGLEPGARYNTPADKFKYAAGDIDPAWSNIQDIEVVVHHFWVDTHLPIKSIDADNRIVHFDRQSRRKLTDDFGNRGAVYYVDNVFEAMDQAGEWYLSRPTQKLYYLAHNGEELNQSRAVIPRLPHVLQINGNPANNHFVENLTFENISFRHTKFDLPPGEAGDYQAAVHVPGAIRLTGARNIVFKNCEVKNVGTYGIELAEGCRNVEITGCEITDTGAGGIRLNGGDANSDSLLRTGNISITDNHIHHLGQIWHAGVGILSQHADNNLFAHNHIHHMYYTGISVGWVWGYKPSVSINNRVEYNHIHHIGQGRLSDMGGVYLLGVSPGTVVRNNLIHDVDSRGYGGWGLYTDEGSTGIVLENNIVYRTKSAGFHQHYGRENIIRNNVFAFGREAQIQRTRNEEHISFTFERNIVYYSGERLIDKNWKENNFRFDYNLYWRTDGPVRFQKWEFEEWQQKGQDLHSRIADPLFVDPAGDNFYLQKDSPAYDIGFEPIDMTGVGPRSWPEEVKEIKFTSSGDGSEQPALFYNSNSARKKPLLVALHTWSSDYRQESSVPYSNWCIQNDWVFIHPNFRGPNKRPEATGSDLVVADILSAVEFAKQHVRVDTNRIYLIGTSGGGYTSLLMAGKAPEVWAGVSAWVPITDLAEWYHDSVELGQKYADDIVASCGGKPGDSEAVDREYCRRSPINFLANARSLPIDINAGIHDGHTGSVPIAHSLKAFNVLASEADRISDKDITWFVEKEMVPDHLAAETADPFFLDKKILFRRSSGKVRITIFEGGHEGIPFAGLQWLEEQSK